MAVDGRLLARARQTLSNIRDENRSEYERRKALVFSKHPDIKLIYTERRQLMKRLVTISFGEKTPDGRRIKPENPREEIKKLEKESELYNKRLSDKLIDCGYKPDYLSPIYDCPHCEDRGYILGKPCACLKKLYEKELTRDLSDLFLLGDECFENVRLDYYPSTKTNGFSSRELMEMTVDILKDYANSFGDGSGSLLFRGGTGLGKSFLSACVARVVSRRGFSVVYVPIVSAIKHFENEQFNREDFSEAEKNRLLSCDLLIIDDLGTEMTTKFTLSAVYTLINSRISGKKATIITTNLSEEEIRARYTPQICSRLEGEYDELSFVGEDIRIIRKNAD